MNKQTITARENFARADVFLSENLQGYTRSSVKKLFQNGLVTANGKPLKPSQEISALTQVEVTLPDAVEYSAKPENIPLDIVYEDADIAVVNKPQGMTVHMGNGNVDGTLVNALLYRLDNLSGINGVIRPGIVHRIDKDTSGLLVVAKNDAAHLSLSLQIEQKTCKRTYLALLEGNLKTDSGTVTTYIGRDPSDRIKMAVVPPEKGKLAITDYTVLTRYIQGYTLCRFDLKTGRTHQIRVHAKYLAHPVVGDPVYGLKKQKFKLNGQLLHAWRLTLKHPVTGEEMTFEAPLPDYFTGVLNKLTEKVAN
ncbi:MAG: RluA family pseudouridine synthase [Clostridia bacterium]|jgi:23S rRNA pseudouridine1911/1915/1917 synthase|nr:RluA family pseudouridine synthase [Clostridia bacterium]